MSVTAPAESFNRRLIAPMLLGSALNPVNSSIIAVSLVPIGRALGAPPSETAWLVSALYLATAIGQPVVGRLVDAYGPRRLYLIGTALVGLAGLLGMIAPTLGVLIAARVLLGFGTCAGYPAAMFLIRSEARRTGKDSPAGTLTALSVATQTVTVIGPTLGGVLIGLGGWRATFAVNVPLALACLVVGSRYLPDTVATGKQAPKLDFIGIGLFAAMLTSLLLFLMHPQAARWPLLGLTAASCVGFSVWERRVPEPFLDLRLLGGNLPLLATYARTLLTMTVSYAFLYGFTQWLEQGRGLKPTAAGLLLLPLFAVGIVVSALTGRRKEVRLKLLAGGVAQIAACALLLLAGTDSPLWLLILVVLMIGIPQGLNNLANQNALYYQADPEQIGSAAGLMRTFGYLGAITASAAGGLVFKHAADTRGLHHLALFLLIVGALFLALTLSDRSLGRVGLPPKA